MGGGAVKCEGSIGGGGWCAVRGGGGKVLLYPPLFTLQIKLSVEEVGEWWG